MNASNVTDLSVKWMTPLGGIVSRSSPAVDGVVYFGAYGVGLLALDASTGEVVWTTPTRFPLLSPPAVASGIVHVLLDAITGTRVWTRSCRWGRTLIHPRRSREGAIYFNSCTCLCEPEDDRVYALSAETGDRIWEGLGEGVWDPWRRERRRCTTTPRGSVQAFDARGCGERECLPLWSFEIGDYSDSSPAIVNGVLYVGADGPEDDVGYLYAFSLPS